MGIGASMPQREFFDGDTGLSAALKTWPRGVSAVVGAAHPLLCDSVPPGPDRVPRLTCAARAISASHPAPALHPHMARRLFRVASPSTHSVSEHFCGPVNRRRPRGFCLSSPLSGRADHVSAFAECASCAVSVYIEQRVSGRAAAWPAEAVARHAFGMAPAVRVPGRAAEPGPQGRPLAPASWRPIGPCAKNRWLRARNSRSSSRAMR